MNIIHLCLFLLASCAIAKEIPLDVLIPKYTDATSQFINIDGVDFHVRQKGKGPTVILLHGILSSLQTWEGWLSKLSKSFHVVSIDLPGHGLTGPDPTKVFRLKECVNF